MLTIEVTVEKGSEIYPAVLYNIIIDQLKEKNLHPNYQPDQTIIEFASNEYSVDQKPFGFVFKMNDPLGIKAKFGNTEYLLKISITESKNAKNFVDLTKYVKKLNLFYNSRAELEQEVFTNGLSQFLELDGIITRSFNRKPCETVGVEKEYFYTGYQIKNGLIDIRHIDFHSQENPTHKLTHSYLEKCNKVSITLEKGGWYSLGSVFSYKNEITISKMEPQPLHFTRFKTGLKDEIKSISVTFYDDSNGKQVCKPYCYLNNTSYEYGETYEINIREFIQTIVPANVSFDYRVEELSGFTHTVCIEEKPSVGSRSKYKLQFPELGIDRYDGDLNEFIKIIPDHNDLSKAQKLSTLNLREAYAKKHTKNVNFFEFTIESNGKKEASKFSYSLEYIPGSVRFKTYSSITSKVSFPIESKTLRQTVKVLQNSKGEYSGKLSMYAITSSGKKHFIAETILDRPTKTSTGWSLFK